jgi:biotin operon repressor
MSWRPLSFRSALRKTPTVDIPARSRFPAICSSPPSSTHSPSRSQKPTSAPPRASKTGLSRRTILDEVQEFRRVGFTLKGQEHHVSLYVTIQHATSAIKYAVDVM